MSLVRPMHVAIALILTGCWGGCAGTGGKPVRDLDRIADPRTNDDEIPGLIRNIRRETLSHDEPLIWVQIADSDGFHPCRRRLALFQLFDRCIAPGMTVDDVAKVLGHATWLGQGQVHEVRNLAGYIPMFLVRGEAVFVVMPELPTGDVSAIYLRVGGQPSANELFNALQGSSNKATDLKITAISLFAVDAAEQDLVRINRDLGLEHNGGALPQD